MTREEAIKGLKVLAKDFSGYKPNEEMFDMAIEALKTDVPDANVGDMISRQAAIDALKTDMAALDHIIQGMSGYDVRLDAYVSQRNQVDCDIDTISNLPTAQPKQRTGKWITADSQCGIRCSVCGVPVDDFCHSIDYIDLDYEPNFCPNCGAKMTEGDANDR